MRVILADDHRIVRDGLRWMLESDDIDVVGEADSGAALIELLDQIEADVVLLDLRMPGMDGLEALEHLRQRHRGLRVIILSMHREPAYIRRAVELGACGYLLKRTSREEVLNALRAVHDGHAYIQGELIGAVVEQAMSPRPAHARSPLSPEESELLALVASGFGNKQIARQLSMSENTVKTRLKRVFEQLGASSRAEAVAIAMRTGVIE